MAFKFNPFSGNFDQTGSGGGGGGSSYIDGEVQNYSALPETIGTPAVDSAYLVREAEGTWLINRKPAGIYIRTANTGVRADDWTYAGAFPDVFNDANFLLYGNADSTKNLAFQLSGITTGTTRTLAVPDASGTLPLLETANTFSANQTRNGTNNVAPNQTAASGSSLMTRELVDARSGRFLFYKVSSALSATSTTKVFDSTTLTIPAGTYEVQAHGRAIYNGSNGGWSFGIERASGNSGTATALIFQHTGESSTYNNTGGAYRASPTLNLFGGNAILSAAASSGTSLHRTGQAAASGLIVVTSELVVVWYVAQVATDASNATTLDENSFLMLTKVA